MGTTKVMLEILSTALSLWKSKEARKYIDEKIKLEKEWYEEFNKPIWKPGQTLEGKRINSKLDDIDLQLRILCNNVSAAVRNEGPST